MIWLTSARQCCLRIGLPGRTVPDHPASSADELHGDRASDVTRHHDSFREDLRLVSECLEFQGIPGRVAEEHGPLLPRFPREPNIGLETTEADVEEVYAVRAALEGLAARAAAERATGDELDELDRLVDLMAVEIAHNAQAARLTDLDIDFHDRIYRSTKNRRLLDAWHAIRSQVHLFQLTRIRLGHEHYREIVVAEHRELATLLRAKDTAKLDRVVEEHVRSGGRALMRQLAAGQKGGSPRTIGSPLPKDNGGTTSIQRTDEESAGKLVRSDLVAFDE